MSIDKNAIWKDNDYNNLVELFETAVKKYPSNKLFGTKNTEGNYVWNTYSQVGERTKNFRGGLAKLGVKANDSVGIICDNSVDWAVAEMATLGLGARFVPMYEKELVSVWEYICKDSGLKILIVANDSIYEKVKDFRETNKSIEKIIIIGGTGDNSMENYEKIGKENPTPSIRPEPKDIAVLIYTSGTTGEPKGVLLSHGNLCFAAQTGYHIYPNLNENSVAFSHLPWAHSYAISAELHNNYQYGGRIGFLDSLDTISTDMQKVKPTVLVSVPRVFSKIHAGIYNKMNETGGITLKLFTAAISEAKKKFRTGKSGLKFKILNKIVIDKIKAQFGGQLKLGLTASAKMNEEVALFFYSIGIPTYDCYGMTETSPPITMNSPIAYKFGSVGKPVESTKVVIDKSNADKESEDGEIIVYGPQVMQGYHNKPQETKATMTEDGGIRTGDLGKFDEEGFLFITGRIKEQYKLQNGKFVYPAQIEEEIKALPYIANAMVYGDGQEYNIGIIVPDFEAIHVWAKEMDLNVNPKELIAGLSKSGSAVKKLLSDEISKHLLLKYAKYEVPKKYMFIEQDFTLEGGELTQTMKLKRKKVLQHYKNDIEMLYSLP